MDRQFDFWTSYMKVKQIWVQKLNVLGNLNYIMTGYIVFKFISTISLSKYVHMFINNAELFMMQIKASILTSGWSNQ